MFNRLPLRLVSLFAVLMLFGSVFSISAQQQNPPQGKTSAQEKSNAKTPTAEQIAETVIFVYGRREALNQVRRNGIENGRITRTLEDGRTEAITYERRFVRGDKTEKDKIRVNQKTPTIEYALIFRNGEVSGIINEASFTPRQETSTEFLAGLHHDIDTLLRYKENGSQLTLVGEDKIKNVDVYILDLVDTAKRRTRYYISKQKWRVLWLEYEEPIAAGATPTKFKKAFYDYKYAQNTLVPYHVILYANDKPLLETNVLTVTYGVKMDDSIFGNSENNASLQ